MATDQKRLPVLDGVRGVAILLVVIGHSLSARNDSLANPIGRLGVVIFFVLSGYLITTKLLADEERCGRVDIRRFYFRRALRIFPAFYAFLLVFAALVVLDVVALPDSRTWIASVFFFRNFAGDGWYTSHLWSLALEEQFYLLWPAMFVLTKRHRLLAVGLAVLATIIYRAIWLHSNPLEGVHSNIHPEFWMDTFLIGASFAIFRPIWLKSAPVTPFVFFLPVWWVLGIAVLWARPFHASVTAVLIGSIIWWCAGSPKSATFRLLSHPALVFLGTISYSVYLWQQFFLGPNLHWWSFPVLAVAGCASYFLIERPFLRLKDRSVRQQELLNCA